MALPTPRKIRIADLVRRLAAIGLLFLFGALRVADAAEEEIVHFRAAAIPPTPLRARLAAAHGEAARPEPGIELTARLARPPGGGPFAALVMLHGCAGPDETSDRARAARYVAWGYAALAIDSFAPRGIRQSCLGVVVDRLPDALGALDYLSALPFIDPARIAIVGYGYGGGLALEAITVAKIARMTAHRFRAAVAYYPDWCPFGGEPLGAPLLILAAGSDDWEPALHCRWSLASRLGEGPPIEFVEYPGAQHGFDNAGSAGRPAMAFGRHAAYDAAADEAAALRMRVFLNATLRQR